MKTLTFLSVFSGSATIILAEHIAPDPNTWCMTYLSTYLAPVSDQVNSPVLTIPAEESGRQPIAPSLKPTFAANISTQARFSTRALLQHFRDQVVTSLGTDLPTSAVLPVASTESGLSPEGPESSALGIVSSLVPSNSDTQPRDSTTGPLTDYIVTSLLSTDLGSTVSTDSIPTSSILVEPAGRSVIFRVSVVNNEKRNINKRQTTGSFVGNDNPRSCTFAATFNLAKGQLFEGGVPIHYSGESYKELAGQDSPTSGSILKTFEDSGRLVFRDPGLPSGEAGFCQSPDGTVYMTFTSGPVGCIPVELVVYDVTQCQNGQLVGDDDLTSTASGTVPTEATATRPESIGPSTQTSGSLASTIISSKTSGPPASSNPAITSISEPEAPIEADSTSFTSTSDGPDNTASTPSIDSASQAVSEVSTATSATTFSTEDVVTSSTDTTDNEATATAADTSGVDTTTASITKTDTTATGTMTSDAPATSSDAFDPSCPATNNPYTASNGVSFTVTCNFIFSGSPELYYAADTFVSCVQACSERETCAAIQFDHAGIWCIFFTEVYEGGTGEASDIIDSAIKNPITDDTTTAAADTTTTDAPVVDTTTSAPPSETSDASSCADLENPASVGSDIYTISCNTIVIYSEIDEAVVNTLLDCLQFCNDNDSCNGVVFEKETNVCFLWSSNFGGEEMSTLYDVAIRQRGE